ncbi:MAG TPA: glycosyltransferase family 4 protein, partial [Chloroflexota bacterium]|nr:glycosyltransferase family 4 protein [Chloroflexota bacterium]
MTVSALTFSLDSQIAWGAAGKAVLGDPAERQRLYAARLKALHVVVKTGAEGGTDPVALAQNAWAYPTHSRSRYTFVLDAYRLGARLCQAHHVDVISSQDPIATGLVAYLLSRRFGKPLNVQVHFDVLDNPYWVGERSEHRLLNAIGKWLIRRADTIRVGTSREVERFASWGIPAERIFVAPVPVDLGQFRQPPSGSQDSETNIHRPTVLNASRLVPQKDLQTLLRAARKVTAYRPDVQFVIAGDGPQREGLEAQVEDLGLGGNVRLLGRIDHKEMPRLLASADLLAVSSVYEGTSLVTVQAAAAGKPVVTTNVAGAADTVKDGETGRVVPIGDVDALANAILEVLSDSDRAARMGAAGQAHVCERFERDKCVEQVVEMWRRTAELGAKQTRHSSPFTDHSPRWLYLANVRVPSEKAHVYQIFQMLDVFRAAGVEVTLAY